MTSILMIVRAASKSAYLAVRTRLSTHFRLVEVAGLAIMAATAALEYRAIRVDERLFSGLNADLIADWSVWNTAMPQHMHWVQYAAMRIPARDDTLPLEKEKVRRFGEFLSNYAIYVTSANSLLLEQRRSLVKFERASQLQSDELVRQCDEAMQQLAEDAGALARGELSDQVTTKSPPEELERFAKTSGQSLYVTHAVNASRACAKRREFDFNALAERKERRVNFYLAIFLIGSGLLGIGKYGNWLNDREKVSRK